MNVAVGLENIKIRFGAVETACVADGGGLQLSLAAPLLGGPDLEVLFECRDAELNLEGGFSFFRAQGRMAGIAVVECELEGIEAASERLYNELLVHTQGLNLQRLWNFVPQINDESLGREVYRSFNVGRWKAFAAAYGKTQMDLHLPAATAVGLREERSRLALVFLAGDEAVEYFENPRQMPAYQYPEEFGPCSPSFARGAVVKAAGGRTVYLSGTSSICGCETVGSGSLAKQFSETMENIRVALLQMGLDDWPGKALAQASQFRLYVRDAADYAEIRRRFAEVVVEQLAGQAVFVQADICRQSLKLEIEGVFRV